jgi:hypothetical protein
MTFRGGNVVVWEEFWVPKCNEERLGANGNTKAKLSLCLITQALHEDARGNGGTAPSF